MWRTIGDIRDAWHLEREGGYGIIDSYEDQAKVARFQHPGSWNDPDVLVVGIYGKVVRPMTWELTVTLISSTGHR